MDSREDLVSFVYTISDTGIFSFIGIPFVCGDKVNMRRWPTAGSNLGLLRDSPAL
jgi:hypothetical protein